MTMGKANHPYKNIPARAFWKKAIAERHYGDMSELAERIPLARTDKIATAGSCFAQHIGNRLASSGAEYIDMEPAPSGWSRDDARHHGFGIYSCRYGNIYTVRQLLQLTEEAFGLTDRKPEVWEKDGRYYDALRPSVDPVGHESESVISDLREQHLAAVRSMFRELDVLVFTLGLTEAWTNRENGLVYPLAPGTSAGNYDPDLHAFHNFRYPEIIGDLRKFWAILKAENPTARMILTVSPVPLTATASPHHVLAATTYSKSVLRAVAGDFSSEEADVHYFPSFEIISSTPGSGWFFNPDKRTVNKMGVDYVMQHFFSCLDGFSPSASKDEYDADVVCDEEKLERYAS